MESLIAALKAPRHPKPGSVELDGGNYAGDGAAGAGLVGLEAAAHGGEEADELAEHYVEDGAVVIGEIRGAVEGEAIVREGCDVFLAAGCDYGADAAEAFAVDFAEKVEFVDAAAGVAREKSDE